MIPAFRTKFLATLLLGGLSAVASCDPKSAKTFSDSVATSSTGSNTVPSASSRPAALTSCGDEWVTDEGIGKLTIGASVDSVRRSCNVVRDTTQLGAEGMPSRTLTVALSSDTVVAEIVNGRVWRIVVTSPRLQTHDSLAPGIPIARVLALDDPRGLVGEGRLFVASPDHCGLSFGSSHMIARVPTGRIGKATLVAGLPKSATVREILIVGCPND